MSSVDLLREIQRGQLWHAEECPDRCSYRADGLDHHHERHEDGSLAILGETHHGSLWEMLEFQGTLGF